MRPFCGLGMAFKDQEKLGTNIAAISLKLKKVVVGMSEALIGDSFEVRAPLTFQVAAEIEGDDRESRCCPWMLR